ncbi:MAG TPA: VCBS repeat-containing protein [Chryseosolibacter sp.]
MTSPFMKQLICTIILFFAFLRSHGQADLPINPELLSQEWKAAWIGLHLMRGESDLGVPQAPGSLPQNERVQWKHLSSANGDFVSPDVGNQSAALVFDIDKDGRDEIVLAGWGDTSMVWYRKKGDSWEKYLMDHSHSHIEAGGLSYDIDGDGDLDVLQGGSWMTNEVWWWENPFPDYDPGKAWTKYTIKDFGAKQHHDQAIGDFDGDGHPDLVFWNQQAAKMLMAAIPGTPKEKSAWRFREIWSWEGNLKYEGMATSDINGDGISDIVAGGFWFGYTGKKFEAHKIDDYSQSRSAAGDLIKGGRPEVVLASGDGIGPLNIYQWTNQRWEKTVLIDEVIHGHTLQVLDVDGDGNLDIFTAEMVL